MILNQIRPGMYEYYRKIIEENAGLHVYGYLPKLEDVQLESRHLGLLTADEIQDFEQIAGMLGTAALKTLHLDEMLSLAATAEPLRYEVPPQSARPSVRLGIAQDAAFCFYYAENLEMLERQGAELVPFSPLEDAALPKNLDGLYIGGGYPELFTKRLSENKSFLASLRGAVENGIPLFAECGGFLYLQEKMPDEKGNLYEMAGILPGVSHMESHLVRFGYLTLTAETDTLLTKKGESVRAHEFHYADTTENGNAFFAQKPNGMQRAAVHQSGSVLAGFPHWYFPSCPHAVSEFIAQMQKYQRKKEHETT